MGTGIQTVGLAPGNNNVNTLVLRLWGYYNGG